MRAPELRESDLLRDAELRAYELIDQPPPQALAPIVDAAAALCDAEAAAVHLITGTEQVRIAGPELAPVPKGASFCGRVIELPGPVYVTEDARVDPVLRDSPFATGEIGAVASYAARHLVGESGTVIGTLCVFDARVLTIERHQLEALDHLGTAVMKVLEAHRRQVELQQALARIVAGHVELRRSNLDLAEFAGQVSHDLKTPLTALTMGLELLDGSSEDPELVASALRSALRMRDLIDSLLDYAVIGGQLAPRPVDLGTLAAEVVDDLGLDDSVVELGPLPRTHGNAVQLRALLQNLVANAVKFAGAVRDPRVVVSGDTGDGVVRVTVDDNGPGVPPARRRAVFEKLERGDASVEGRGIGLATCARIVAAHGGRIGVDDAPTGGARFWFELPAG